VDFETPAIFATSKIVFKPADLYKIPEKHFLGNVPKISIKSHSKYCQAKKFKKTAPRHCRQGAAH
jgi:hypothetical protein